MKTERLTDMNKVIVPTGYMGTGSSAITDLLSEFSGFDVSHGHFEYVFMHCPNGIFDLEDKLLVGNNAIRSDEALHSFYFTMKQLYNKKYWWVGHYDVNISNNFLSITEQYIEDLIQYRPDFYWYHQENTNLRMAVQLVFRKIVRLLSLHKINLKKPLLYDQMWISYIEPDEFYEKTKKYLNRIFSELGLNNQNIVLDQLLLPFNLYRINNYFDDNIEVFIVDRDPRDMFLINKYIYPSLNEQVPYPTDVYEFCKCYRSLREMERNADANRLHIHRIHFEDLIYKYDVTVDRIRNVLISEDGSLPEHIDKKKYFNPDKSINNTQLFIGNAQYNDEEKVIEKYLSEYLYEFPYRHIPDKSTVF